MVRLLYSDSTLSQVLIDAGSHYTRYYTALRTVILSVEIMHEVGVEVVEKVPRCNMVHA